MTGPKMERDPDNPNTVILDRWPTEEEKEQFSKDVRRVRRGEAPEEPESYVCRKGCGESFGSVGGRTYHENNSATHADD